MSTLAQTNYEMQKIQRESLNRGVVAIKTADGKVAVSWRKLMSDKTDEAFDVYRNGKKLNKNLLTQGGTFFIDENPADKDTEYKVCGGGKDGTYLLKADTPVGYLPIPISKPTSTMTTNRGNVTYSANDASIGDVDGDGQYEIILKWDPSNSADNSRAGYTDKTYLDCYRLDGTHLWRIDLGKNIRSGAHYSPFLVYDFNGDGKAEVMVKTADGTIDGQGKVIGDSTKDWRTKEEGASYGRIMDGPEYLSVFNGLTGAEMATTDYIPGRGENGSWGDTHGNRSERYLAAIAYLDGIHPSAIFCRGYYTRSVLAAFNITTKGEKSCIDNVWTFDTDKDFHEYAGQGNHNLRVADFDGDGCDEITYGSMCVDNNGKGLYNTGFGHGDAMHIVADPKTDKLFIWDVHENKRDGSELRDAKTGEVVFQKKADFDVGRGMAADIDPTNYGVEMWSSNTRGILNVKGEYVRAENYKEETEGEENNSQDNNIEKRKRGPRNEGSNDNRKGINGEGRKPVHNDGHRRIRKTNKGEINYSDFNRSSSRLSCNSAVWWDGDLLRELLDHERVTKYNWKTGMCDELIHFDGRFNNWTKSNPCLSADIIGDWREEVLIRNDESTELRLYVSPIPTTYRINCLEEDIPYRIGVALENVGYNQPPDLGYYLGPDRPVK